MGIALCLQSSFFSSYTDNFARVLIIRVKEFVGDCKLNIKMYPDRVFRIGIPRRDMFCKLPFWIYAPKDSSNRHSFKVGLRLASFKVSYLLVSANPCGKDDGEKPVTLLKILLKLRMVINPHLSAISVIVSLVFPLRRFTARSQRAKFKYCEKVMPVRRWNSREK